MFNVTLNTHTHTHVHTHTHTHTHIHTHLHTHVHTHVHTHTLIHTHTHTVCMFLRFLTGNAEAYSTEPLKNENEELALGFYHMQNVRELNGLIHN